MINRRRFLQDSLVAAAGLKLFAAVMVIGIVLAIALPKVLDRRKPDRNA